MTVPKMPGGKGPKIGSSHSSGQSSSQGSSQAAGLGLGLSRFGLRGTLDGLIGQAKVSRHAISEREASCERSTSSNNASRIWEVARREDAADQVVSPEEARRFSELPLSLEADGLLLEVDRFLAQGVAIDAIYIDLLAPSARRLGELWERDQCDFVDVTMGLWRLQEVLHEISSRNPTGAYRVKPSAKRAMFLPMPGDQHFFGAQMLDDVFARAGWNTLAMTKPLRKEILYLLSCESFDLVGLTLSRDCPSAAVKNIIKAMRSVSRNEHIKILVGGHMIHQNPALVAEVGADGTGADARAALEVAEALVQSSKVRAQTLR